MTDLADALGMLGAVMRRRGLAVVVSDWLTPSGWELPLSRLAARHDVLAVEVVDPRELELPNVGLLEFVDPETGAVREVQTSDAGLRERYATAAASQRATIAAGITRPAPSICSCAPIQTGCAISSASSSCAAAGSTSSAARPVLS